MHFDISNIRTTHLSDDLFTQKQVSLDVLRLEEIHPIVSGNKLFKLHYFLEEAIASTHKTIFTFGGAWSNHLLATAFACKSAGLKSIGIVRGEEQPTLSFTLQQCIHYGMQLKFISREVYAAKEDPLFIQSLKTAYGECLLVPEGGYHASGAKGAALIMDQVKDNDYTHICTAVGTATTLSGLLMAAKKTQEVIGISVLKGMTDIEERILSLTGGTANMQQLQLFHDHHFGGYAKRTSALIDFMNQCWKDFQLPLDIVYTSKMLYAVFDAIKNDHFPGNSKILCLHTGGLQGNRSLPVDTLLY